MYFLNNLLSNCLEFDYLLQKIKNLEAKRLSSNNVEEFSSFSKGEAFVS